MNTWKGLLFWKTRWEFLISHIDLPLRNSCLLNITSLKDVDDSLVKSSAWNISLNKPFFAQFPVSELLPSKLLWSPSMSCSSNSSSSWGSKFFDKLSSSPDIDVSYLSCICRKRICWLVNVFICLVNACVDSNLFLYPRQLLTLVDNILRILFRLRFGITSMRERAKIVLRLEFLISQH